MLNVKLKSGKTAGVDTLLAAAGRSGNTAGMNLEAIGVTPSSRGQLEVNAHYQTSVPHVYAAGDVIGFPALASTSMEQARVAMVHAFDLKYKTAVALILPYGIYTIPECSVAGETEESLQKQNIPYVAGRARYEHNPRGQIIGDRDGFLKLLFREEDMRLLGVSVIGEQATELVHVGLTALLAGSDRRAFHSDVLQLSDAVRAVQVRHLRRTWRESQTPRELSAFYRIPQSTRAASPAMTATVQATVASME